MHYADTHGNTCKSGYFDYIISRCFIYITKKNEFLFWTLMSIAHREYQSWCHDGNECIRLTLLRRDGYDPDRTSDGNCRIDDHIPMESIWEGMTSRMVNIHSILQPIPYVPTRRMVRTEFPMDLHTSGIRYIDDHQLFQDCKELLKTSDIRTRTPVPQSHLHPDPRFRQLYISK